MTSHQAPELSGHRGSIAFRDALLFWLKLGFISFGGPAGQIAVMHHELVEKRRWISERRFLHALNYCMLLPGPEAQQLATYIGWLTHRTWGGIIAGALFVLPSLALLIVLSWIYLAFGHAPAIAGVLYGIKPAVTAIVAFAAWRIGSRILRNPVMWALAIAAFIGISVLHVAFPIIIGAAALIGVLGHRFAPAWFALADHVADDSRHEPCVIDDDTPTPAHARFNRKRLLCTLAIGLLLWILAIGTLAQTFGADGVFTSMAWFFTKAALLTFGGAYAVLPYVVEGAVEQHHWLSAAQMLDGLALGETTPGPLIMVAAFVGFVGGWTLAVLGPDHLAVAGATAAVIVTFFTFLPSFLFILLGGPLVETTRRQPRIAAPLAAITAAIVGVILNLAVYFALNVLWPAGLNGAFEWPLALIGIVAFACLIRFRIGVVPVIVACGAAGLLLTLVAG